MSSRVFQIIFYGDPYGYPPIINCARGLAEAGWRVEIFCRDEHTHDEVRLPDSVSVRRIAGSAKHRWSEYATFVWKAASMAKGGTIVAGHDMHGLIPAALVSLKSGTPLVYHCHDFAERGRILPAGSRVVKWLERLVARRARMTLVPDERRAQVVKEQLGLRSDPFVMPNAPRMGPRPQGGALRSELRSAGHEFERIVLRQGRVGPGHGIEATIRSMPFWESQAWGFIVVGPAEPRFAQGLRDLANQIGVANRFVILPPVSYDRVPSLTVDADLGHALYDPININHIEMGTASNKVLEYMAAGIPILVPESTSFNYLVSRFHCGICVDPESPDAIAAAISRVLRDEAMDREMGNAGRRGFESELNYDIHFARLEERLESLCTLL